MATNTGIQEGAYYQEHGSQGASANFRQERFRLHVSPAANRRNMKTQTAWAGLTVAGHDSSRTRSSRSHTAAWDQGTSRTASSPLTQALPLGGQDPQPN